MTPSTSPLKTSTQLSISPIPHISVTPSTSLPNSPVRPISTTSPSLTFHPHITPPLIHTTPTNLQQQLDALSISTNMKIESLTSTFTQKIDQLMSLLHTTPPPPPHQQHMRTPTGPSHRPPPPPSQPFADQPEQTIIRGPKLPIDPPKFDGTDPTGWIFRVEEYFDFYSTPPDDRLRLVGILMDREASEWFRWVRHNNVLTSWDEFLSQVRLRFDTHHFEDYFGTLSNLKQSSSVSAYQADFERLLNKVTGVPEPALMSVFIAGLKPHLRREMNLRRPTTLSAAFAIARELAALHVEAQSALSQPQRRSWSAASLLHEYHASPSAGHTGVQRTFYRLASTFYWPRMRHDVRKYIAACYTCQSTKYATQPPGGLLQPLPIPSHVWDHVSMDFITGLPPSRGYSAIMVVVDRLTKYSHFGALPTGFDAHRVAALFVEVVIKHHGFPSTIISDRDPIFVSKFWSELFRLSGTSLKRSTAYHPQTDGQTEVLNRSLEQYLRAFTHAKPTRWSILLPWAEYSLNTSYHEGLKMTPFQALYGRPPPPLFPYTTGECKLPAVDAILTERDTLLQQLRSNLIVAQQRMRDQANKHRRDVQFAVGDKVLLKLQPYRQHSVARSQSVKLSRRFYGPFEVLERVGAVAYRLQLPSHAKIHPVFHVSLLKPFVGTAMSAAVYDLPAELLDGRPCSTPVAILRSRTILRQGKPEEQWLIQWSDGSLDDATWEPSSNIRSHFPNLHVEDKVLLQPGGDDTGPTASAQTTQNEPMSIAGSPEEVTQLQPRRSGRQVGREYVHWQISVAGNNIDSSTDHDHNPRHAVAEQKLAEHESNTPSIPTETTHNSSKESTAPRSELHAALAGEKIPLYDVAHSRVGDKGNDLNFSLIPHYPPDIRRLKMIVTPIWVKEVLSPLLNPSSFPDPDDIERRDKWVDEHVKVEIYEARGIQSLNVVVRNILDGGVNCSRRIDRHGKTISDVVLCQQVVLPP